jgi:internalin A
MRDVDYRALHALLRELDPAERWGGLSRTCTPEGEILWLCDHHVEQYGT